MTKTISGNGTNIYTYGYNAYNRLGNVTLPNDHGSNTTTDYSYNYDGTVAGIAYNSTDAPANVTFNFDYNYPRLTEMDDGIGTTNYTYNAVGSNGALQLATVSGPFPNATLSYTYDDLGRLTSRAVESDDLSVTYQGEAYTYDALDRTTLLSDTGSGGNLGNFTLTYNGNTTQLTGLAYPNGLNTTLGYLAANHGAWLANITNNVTINATTTLFSQFNYARRNDGSISAWQQQFGWATANLTSNASTATQKQLYTFGYDASGWLISATLGAAANATTLQDTYQGWTFGYDNSGNPVDTAVNSAGLSGNYNAGNQLVEQDHIGTTRIAGFTDEPANITVNGNATRQWSLPGGRNFTFESDVLLTAGTSNVTINATDSASHTTSKVYTVNSGGSAATFTYDAKGDRLTEITDPTTGIAVTANYPWDSIGRLHSFAQGNNTITFDYDGLGHRVYLSANIGGNTTDEYYIWDGDQIAQKRTSGNDSANISAIYYNNGYQTVSGGNATGNFYYTKDHLGSVREVLGTDGGGHPALEGRFSYGPWGETIYMDYSGGNVAQPQFGFDGYFQTSYLPALYLTEYRAYEPGSRAWLSRDPLGEAGGLNPYGFVNNDPVDRIDKKGLEDWAGMEGMFGDPGLSAQDAGARGAAEMMGHDPNTVTSPDRHLDQIEAQAFIPMFMAMVIGPKPFVYGAVEAKNKKGFRGEAIWGADPCGTFHIYAPIGYGRPSALDAGIVVGQETTTPWGGSPTTSIAPVLVGGVSAPVPDAGGAHVDAGGFLNLDGSNGGVYVGVSWGPVGVGFGFEGGGW